MHAPVLTDYENVRKEIEALKKCIVDYQGFLFVGLGVLLTGWALSTHATEKELVKSILGLVALSASLIATFMLTILIYKFDSHNRCTGYNLLLASEVWPDSYKHPIILWERCVNIIRARPILTEVPAGETLLMSVIFGIPNALNDLRFSALGSLWYLIKAMFGISSVRSSSWGFPVPVVRIFSMVVLLLASAGLYVHGQDALDVVRKGIDTAKYNGVFCVVVLILQIFFWRHIAIRYRSVMEGNATISRYAIRFLFIRHNMLIAALHYAPDILTTGDARLISSPVLGGE